MPCVVGLTGGIATGKSSVSRRLRRDDGVRVIDADEVSRQVVRKYRPAWWLLRAVFGRRVFSASDGSLDRAALGRTVFADPAARRTLNLCLHPFILGSMLLQTTASLLIHPRTLVILEAPLLFESGVLVWLCNATMVVSCAPHTQLQRLRERDSLSEGDAQRRICSQMPLEQKVARATYVIDNDGTPERAAEQVDRLMAELRPAAACSVRLAPVLAATLAAALLLLGACTYAAANAAASLLRRLLAR